METERPAGDAGAAPAAGSGRSPFVTTQWSVVLAAGGGDRARDALEALCRTYWPPLYAYLRRRGYGPHDAEDLVQGFLARLLARDDVAGVRPERGKFRSYLLGALNHYLSDERDRARAQKRGAGRVVSWDFSAAEATYADPAVGGEATPDQLYDRQWAVAVLADVQRRLRRAYAGEGRADWFDALRFTLSGDQDHPPYAELARRLGAGESAVKVAAHRLRKRYRALLREVIAETVADPGQVEEELHCLREALAGRPPL